MKTIEIDDPNKAMSINEECDGTHKDATRKFSEGVPAKKKLKIISTDEAIALASQSSRSKVAGKRHIGFQEKAYKKVQASKKRVENIANVERRIGDLRVCSAEKQSALPSSEQKRCLNPPVHPSVVPRPSSKQKSFTENSVHTHTPSPISKISSELRSSKESSAELTRYKKLPVHESMPSTAPGSSSKQKSCRENPAHPCTPSPISKPSHDPRSSKESSAHAHAGSTKSGLGLAQGGTPCKDTLKKSDNAGEERLTDKQLTIDRHLPNHPASSAVWKGTLTIGGYYTPVGSCNDVWAYPPSKLSKKAYEFSMKMQMQMQESLHFEPIPRSAVWGNMFHDRGPDEFDIGLYFLPSGDKSEHCCSRLISYLEKEDIALRCFIYGIQLLIFSSSHLEESSKKINDAYYLWGLFAPPVIKEQVRNVGPAVIQHTPENEGPAGMETGAPVPSDSHPSCSKTSKAATSASQPISDIQVKLEKSDNEDLASPPKSSARAAMAEPRIPPGFKKKYKTISEILRAGED